MTSGSPWKLIDYNTYRQYKRLASYCSQPSTGRLSASQQQNLTESVRLYRADAGKNLDARLRALENSARHQYVKIYKTLTFEKLPEHLEHLLDQNIQPILRRIGFENVIARMLFEIAPSAWRLMVPANKKIVPFQPLIEREIQEVRDGVKSEIHQRGDTFLGPSGDPRALISGSIKDGLSPEHLFKVLDEIATPWIILPRAFRFLKIHHSRYLPVYLKTIELETREICLNLFSRITVEFMGNFTFKFADRRHSPRQLSKLIFYGYSALFWKSLRCPPQNMENSTLFDNYLNWLSRFGHQSYFFGKEEQTLIDQMSGMRNRIFPTLHSRRPCNGDEPDSSRFLITLRHGRAGMATILKYFGIDQFLKTRRTANRFASPFFQNELHSLLQRIRTQYPSESERTRENIKQFIGWIKTAYTVVQPDFHQAQRLFLDQILNNMQKSLPD